MRSVLYRQLLLSKPEMLPPNAFLALLQHCGLPISAALQPNTAPKLVRAAFETSDYSKSTGWLSALRRPVHTDKEENGSSRRDRLPRFVSTD